MNRTPNYFAQLYCACVAGRVTVRVRILLKMVLHQICALLFSLFLLICTTQYMFLSDPPPPPLSIAGIQSTTCSRTLVSTGWYRGSNHGRSPARWCRGNTRSRSLHPSGSLFRLFLRGWREGGRGRCVHSIATNVLFVNILSAVQYSERGAAVSHDDFFGCCFLEVWSVKFRTWVVTM